MDIVESFAKKYVDHLHNGGTDVNIQKYLVLTILDQLKTDRVEYTDKLFSTWPTFQDDIENCMPVLNQRFPHTICEEFVLMNVDKEVRIIDVGCGPGYVASLLREHGYVNIDGLDKFQCMVDVSRKKDLYKHVYCSNITPDKQSEVESGQYDALVCSAAMFPACILPESFYEFVRIVKIGGVIIWNIVEGYKDFEGFESYDEIIQKLIDDGVWCEVQPRKRAIMYLDVWGFVYVMKRLK